MCLKCNTKNVQLFDFVLSKLLDKTNSLTSKWLEQTWDDSESEIKVSDNFGSYFNDETVTEMLILLLLMENKII